ncbi:MAG TPA: GNAT family N-acetyltransferase [Thermoanaerobaculia bacterium]|jgi:GNAT superfamily N-acetyltransferase|nr:GNAT family N-acetyltransferase [Thermoanaerobaculia bacterium]
MIIRVATPADAATLAAISLKTFVDTFAPHNTPADMDSYTSVAFTEEKQRREIEAEGTITLLGEEDGEAIAYAQIRKTAGAPHGDVELARFYVDQPHHGRGIAQMLMDAVETHARVLGCTRIWLGVWEHNLRAITFYRKHGFVQRGAQPFLLGTDLQTDLVMNRPL